MSNDIYSYLIKMLGHFYSSTFEAINGIKQKIKQLLLLFVSITKMTLNIFCTYYAIADRNK